MKLTTGYKCLHLKAKRWDLRLTYRFWGFKILHGAPTALAWSVVFGFGSFVWWLYE